MTFVLAGVASGLVMSTVFVGVAPLMLLELSKDSSSILRRVLGKVSPLFITMSVTVIAYPFWIIVGAILGLIYRLVAYDGMMGGLGSPNIGFSVALLAGALVGAVVLALLFPVLKLGFSVLALAFVVSYGWLLPILSRVS